MAERVVAVLGYSRRGEDRLHPICAGRLARAAALASEHDVVLFTGGGNERTRPEASWMRAAWNGRSDRVVLDEAAQSTADNARRIAAVAKEVGAHELVVVTSSWHRPRASVLLRAALRGSQIRLRMATPPPTRPFFPVVRELACALALPVQLVRAGRKSRPDPAPSAGGEGAGQVRRRG